jgi:hypothetical protein
MAIADYEPPKRKIALPDGKEFEVRALSLGDLAPIMAINQDAIELLVSRIGARLRSGQAFDTGNPADVEFFTEIAGELLRTSPTVIGAIIAYASDEPAEYLNALQLPLTVQADALNAIAELTFTDIAAIKRFLAGVMNIWRGMVPARPMALASVA